MPALWDRAHPFAFYSWQDVLYVFNTYILQESDGTEIARVLVKQKAFSPIAIPAEWTSNTEYDYTTSGTVGDDGNNIIVTRTYATGLSTIDAQICSKQIIYNLQGQRIARPQRGQIVIQRNADGTGRKVLVK